MALRHLSPNHCRELSLTRELSFESKFHSPATMQRASKRARPNLSLEIPCITPGEGEHVLSMRRTGSWEEGSLADFESSRGNLLAEEVARTKAFVSQLVEMNVKLLALDFDLTIVSMHTGGRWWGSAETLARSVRPVFKTIVPYAMSLGLEVAIVTLSQ